MRYVMLLVCVAVVGCSQATAGKIGPRTYAIDGPQIGGITNTPNRRLAERLCPKGYRVLGQESFRGGSGSIADRGATADSESQTTTSWKIRCL